MFIANSPAYASEVVPLALRGACTATLQMSWSIGGIIVAAATYGFNMRNDEWAWRGPLALQWIFPVSDPSLVCSPYQLTSAAPADGTHLVLSRISMVAYPPRTQG
jgi:hypothetical protein